MSTPLSTDHRYIHVYIYTYIYIYYSAYRNAGDRSPIRLISSAV